MHASQHQIDFTVLPSAALPYHDIQNLKTKQKLKTFDSSDLLFELTALKFESYTTLGFKDVVIRAFGKNSISLKLLHFLVKN